MNRNSPLITLVMVLLGLTISCYMAFALWNTFNTPYTTTVAYAYTNNDSVETTGLLVREELPLTTPSGILEGARSEGEKVAKGKVVAMAHRDGQAMSVQSRQEQLQREIEMLEYAAAQGGDISSTARLDEDILQALVSLRSSTALDSFNRLEDQVIQLKSAVLKRDLTYGADLTTQQLKDRLVQLRSELRELSHQSSSATTRITAPQPGVYSAQVDGCESIHPQQLLSQPLDELLAILDQGRPDPQSDTAGKIITGDRWYLLLALTPDQAMRLKGEQRVTVRFTGDFSQDVEMEVARLVVVEGRDQGAVVLSTDQYLSQTTLLRRQTVELIYRSTQGIRVPKLALRMLQEEDGEQQITSLGVYAIVNGRAIFKEGEIVSEGSDFYILRSVTQGKNALRPGDEIVLRATGLFNGKLMEG